MYTRIRLPRWARSNKRIAAIAEADPAWAEGLRDVHSRRGRDSLRAFARANATVRRRRIGNKGMAFSYEPKKGSGG